MKKKILLVYPPAPVLNREDRCQQPVKDLLIIPPLPPTDLMYLASIAELEEFEAKIVDYSFGGDFLADLEEFEPDYLLVNVAMPTLDSDLHIVDVAKKRFPKLVTIVKGAPFLTYNKDALYEHKYIDLVIVGEAEDTLKEILEGKPYPEILGICYRDGFMAKFSGNRPFIKDLDSLPFPARQLIDNSRYKRPDNGKVQAVIKVSRGCPHHCFFCLATPVSGPEVRYRSPENIIDEIQECIKLYKITNFIFWSDIFNQDRIWTINLCKKIIDSNLKITWSSNTRADTIDEDMAKLMYKAGCRLASVGVESGSQFILDKIGKNTTIFDARDCFKFLKKAKIKTYAYFVLGLPWDDEYTIKSTIDFAIELNPDFVSFYTAAPLPSTRFYNYAKTHNMFDKDYSYNSAYYYPMVKTHCLTKERIMELHKLAVKKFYLRPEYIFKMLLNIRSFRELINYTKAGFSILFASH